MVLAAGAFPAAALAQASQPGVLLLDTAELVAPLLNESSGIVASRTRTGVFWTMNDSGNDPLLFATDSAGTDLGYLRVAGASNIDWESMSTGPCLHAPGTCLYIGDTGGNSGRRPFLSIYVMPEPVPPSGRSDTLRVVNVQDTLRLTYPDHAHDAEAIAVVGSQLWLVTKDRSGPAVLFRTPLRATLPGLRPMETRPLQRVGDLALGTSAVRGRIVTDMGLSPDSRMLVVRTYVSLHLFAVRGDTALPAALLPPGGMLIPVVEAQGEGVCFDQDGRLILTSERADIGHAILTRLRLTGLPRP
jgi:hypothetical protein